MNNDIKKTQKNEASAADKPLFDETKLEKALRLSNDELIADAIRDVLLRDAIHNDTGKLKH